MKNSQQNVWNKIAETWSKFRKKSPDETGEFLRDKKGKVLDLGCGSGRNIIANPDITYYCVDFSEKMLEFAEKDAKQKKANAVFFKCDIGKEKLPFKDNFFDSAVFICTLHCIDGEKNRENALKELYRVMKKNAEAMISVWNKSEIKKFRGEKIKEGFLKWAEGKYDRYYYFYDRDELKEILEKTGFKVLKIENAENINEKSSKYSRKNFIAFVKK